MCTSLHHWMALALLGSVASACGGSLVLPDDNSPAVLRAVAGDRQEATVGSRLDDPLIVQVLDASSQPIAGVPVEFYVGNGSPEAEVTPSAAITNAEGEAAAEVRLGSDPGPLTVEAQVSRASSDELRASFDLTALAKEKDKKGKGGGRDNDEDDEDEEDDED